MVKINGTYIDVAGISVAKYLITEKYDTKRIAVERNGNIVLKSEYEHTIMQDGDCIEIVNFVGGG